jgi:hypothetical protein
MLFVLTGSSAAGKTAVLNHLVDRVENLMVHDFDEVGVPPGADRRWRQRLAEAWVSRVLQYQCRSIDTLVAGQTPLGEWLAAPSVTRVDGIASCLLHVDPDVQAERLEARRRRPGDPDPEDLLAWAAWHREHAVDPHHEQSVITENGWEAMRWERWERWRSADLRWGSSVVDTSCVPLGEIVSRVRRWIAESRGLHAVGKLPLSGPWWDGASAETPEASRSRT